MPVDATYVINLPRASERWSRVASRLDLAGIPYARYDGVDGRAIQRSGTPPPDVHPVCWHTCTPGVLGCALSHINLWKVCAAAGHEHTLILEDDVVLCKDFGRQLADVVSHAPSDYDILLIGYTNPITSHTYALSPPESMELRTHTILSPDVVNKPRFYGTHAYVLSRSGALKLSRVRATFQVDIQLSLTPGLHIYAAKQALASQEQLAQSHSFVTSDGFPAASNRALQALEVPVLNLYGQSKLPPWMACILIALAALYAPRVWLAAFFVIELGVGGFSWWWWVALSTATLFSFTKA